MNDFTGLRIALRFGVAVFVSPRAALTDKLDWDVTRSPEGALKLKLRNSGNHHLRLNSLKINDPSNGQQLAEPEQSPITLLPGQSREISLPLPAGWRGRQLILVANTDSGMSETRIELEPSTR